MHKAFCSIRVSLSRKKSAVSPSEGWRRAGSKFQGAVNMEIPIQSRKTLNSVAEFERLERFSKDVCS